MARPQLLLLATLLALLVAACSSSPESRTASPAVPPATPTASPVAGVPSAPSAAPAGGLADFSSGERYLLDGVLRGATDCQPAGGSDELPRAAIAGIECNSPNPSVARVAFYLFAGDQEMLQAYVAEMKAVNIELETGSCDANGGDRSYAPGVDFIIERAGCFLDGEQQANYRALLPLVHVSIAVRGRSDDMGSLEDFTWLGSGGYPSSPTLWAEPT